MVTQNIRKIYYGDSRYNIIHFNIDPSLYFFITTSLLPASIFSSYPRSAIGANYLQKRRTHGFFLIDMGQFIIWPPVLTSGPILLFPMTHLCYMYIVTTLYARVVTGHCNYYFYFYFFFNLPWFNSIFAQFLN